MLKKLLALITSLVMLAALAPYALANQGESTLEVYMDEDFEGEVGEDSLYNIPNWGDVAGSKLTTESGNTYFDCGSSSGLYYYNPGGTKTAMSTPLVIDFKGNTSVGYFALGFRDAAVKKWPAITRKNISKNVWRYYRLVIDYDENNEVIYDWYESSTGWDSMTLYTDTSSLVKPDWNTPSNQIPNISGIKFDNVKIDDVKIYNGGIVPTAAVTVEVEDGTYTANYTYTDVDGEAQGATAIQWESSLNGTDNWTAIQGATEAEFTPADDFDGYIRAVVTPKSTRYPVEGTAVASESIRIAPVPVSTLTVYMDEDFEREIGEASTYNIPNWADVASSSLATENDNTYFNGSSFGIYYYSPNGTKTAMSTPLVIDFKGSTSIGYFSMGFRNTTGKTYWPGITRKNVSSDVWGYYRLVIDYDENNEVTYDWYESSTGWDSMELVTNNSILIKPDWSTASNQINNFSGFKFDNLKVDDIKIYNGGIVPTATVTVAVEDGTYTANYTYTDVDGEAQGATAIQWESSLNGTDNWTAIQGATEAEFTPAYNFDGYIRAVVTPKSTRYPAEGTAVASESIRVIAKLVIDSSTGVYTAMVNLSGLEKDDLWGILAVYNGGALVEAKIKKDITVTNGAAQFTITGDERVSGLTAPSARFFLWEAETLVPVRTFE